MAGGATGILFTRWRPLLDGPLFGAFGPMGMDGSLTPRAEMAGKLAAGPTRMGRFGSRGRRKGRGNRVCTGVPGFQLRADQRLGPRRSCGGGRLTHNPYRGAYQAFFDSNIQADFVRYRRHWEYPMIYLAYPEMLKKSTAQKLRDYVAKGGKLVSEGCPGILGTAVRLAPSSRISSGSVIRSPRELVPVHSRPADQADSDCEGQADRGSVLFAGVQAGGGEGCGPVRQRHIAAVENTTGAGKTLLIGTFPGGAYFRGHAPATREFSPVFWLGRRSTAGDVERPGGESPASSGSGRHVSVGGQSHAHGTDGEDLTRFHVPTGSGNCGRNPAARRSAGTP